MSKTADLSHQRIDAFVAAVNAAERESMPFEDVPEACRRKEIDLYGWHSGWCDWQIVPSGNVEWLAGVESRLPFRLPPTFRSLISRYSFPPFEIGPIKFLSVGAEETHTEFRFAVFADRFMSPFLFKSGFLQFARPAGGSYDPVCFDFRASARKSEPAVVCIDHEEILCNERIRVTESLSPSFYLLIEEFTRRLQSGGAP